LSLQTELSSGGQQDHCLIHVNSHLQSYKLNVYKKIVFKFVLLQIDLLVRKYVLWSYLYQILLKMITLTLKIK